MHDRQTRYQTIEVNLRHALEDARQIGDDFLAYLIEIALLETRTTTSQEPKTGGEARARGDC
tara:strand:+ start:394 stop:579 length:186 start_codon:yes stop_codon:yes gene_type:complete